MCSSASTAASFTGAHTCNTYPHTNTHTRVCADFRSRPFQKVIMGMQCPDPVKAGIATPRLHHVWSREEATKATMLALGHGGGGGGGADGGGEGVDGGKRATGKAYRWCSGDPFGLSPPRSRRRRRDGGEGGVIDGLTVRCLGVMDATRDFRVLFLLLQLLWVSGSVDVLGGPFVIRVVDVCGGACLSVCLSRTRSQMKAKMVRNGLNSTIMSTCVY